jgi:hypothetical protein
MKVLRVEEISKINSEIQSITPDDVKKLPTPSKRDLKLFSTDAKQ